MVIIASPEQDALVRGLEGVLTSVFVGSFVLFQNRPGTSIATFSR
jgi:hypothetical protein